MEDKTCQSESNYGEFVSLTAAMVACIQDKCCFALIDNGNGKISLCGSRYLQDIEVGSGKSVYAKEQKYPGLPNSDLIVVGY